MHAELPQLGFDQTGALGVLGFVEVVAQGACGLFGEALYLT